MDSHLIHIPGLRALTARGLSGSDLQDLSRESHWTLDSQVLRLGSLEEFRAYFLKGCDFAAGEGNSDFVCFLRTRLIFVNGAELFAQGRAGCTYWALAEILLWFLERHFCDS